jgi:hypothetical protein
MSVFGIRRDCYLGQHGILEKGDVMQSCEGALIRAHLIPQQLLKRWGHHHLVNDPATWVWACGGIMGVSGHHGLMDHSRRLWLPYEAIPSRTIECAKAIGLDWWLEHEYRPFAELVTR